jgi:FAD/FMN-containing dehydrogenase
VTGHRAATKNLLESYRSIPEGTPVRLAKRTSNLFRFRDDVGAPGLDVSGFDQVLSVDPTNRTADVQGMTTYEDLVDATLPYGLMPLVVPQLKTITLGGAVTGLGIESSSFHHGLPHESVIEMEIITGGGEIVTATRDNEHRDLFYGFPNSYGTLGYALRLKIKLQPVKPFVELRHVRFGSAQECAEAIDKLAPDVDFIDGTVFSGDELYLTLGTFADEAKHVSDYTGQKIYYRSIQDRNVTPRWLNAGTAPTDVLTTHAYLWRWDTDWFWCSRAFGVQNPLVRRVWPAAKKRSDVYRHLVALDKRAQFSARIDRWRGKPPREDVIQDVEVPVERLPDFLDFFRREIGMSPVWLCPLRAQDKWPLYPLEPGRTYVNVGFWGTVPIPTGRLPEHHNRLIEREVARLEGHKSLYSTAFYTRDDFWRHYDGVTYRRLKEEYDPGGRLLDLYDKTVRGR